MILTDREIRNSIASGLIDVNPRPTPDAYASTTLDLKLGSSLRAFKEIPTGTDMIIDPRKPGYNVIKLIKQITDAETIDPDPKKGYILEPNKLSLGWTQETIHLKEHGRVATWVEGKSSLSRIGLSIHVNAPTIHAGFRGPI